MRPADRKVWGMQTALVTGSNSGIGRAAALRLAADGYRVFAGMRDVARGEKLLDLAREAGVEVHPVTIDVASDGSVRKAMDAIQAEVGALDVLGNNAGVGMNATTEDVDIEAGKAVFEVNYWGVVRCIQGCLPAMRERGAGTIVNVSSIAGRIAALGQIPYSSSKWAVEALSEGLAQEMAPFGVRVVIIEPGVTRTAILPKNAGHPAPTAYEAAYRRMLQFYARGIEASIPAEAVAATISEALDDQNPKLRYRCAWGGEELVEGRARMTDEQWVDLGRATDDSDYYAGFSRLFGLDLA